MPTVARRSPDEVMKLARMGAAHPTRLSFMRSLLRMLHRDGWRFERRHWEFDDGGVGTAAYTAHGPARSYTLIAFGHELDDDQRSDRVIATAWDATFTLFDGIPTIADLDRLREQVPYQEAGRVSETELTLSRANRSVRMFDHCVERLAEGRQPDVDLIEQVGYLMRTTAVYGSGKFGAADRGRLLDRAECLPSFRIEMLSVWLIRQFTTDLVEHLAAKRAPETAVVLTSDLRRRFGVGNSTGLGMAPFLANHPALLHTWVDARELALARVRSAPLRDGDRDRFTALATRAVTAVADWHTDDDRQGAAIAELRRDLDRLHERLDQPWNTWNELHSWAEAHLTLEGQELVVALLIECSGHLVDDLADTLFVDEQRCFEIDAAMSTARLLELVESTYQWALSPDYTSATDSARFWYTSEEKLEPRLGQRFEEPGAELELPLAVGRDIAALFDHLRTHDDAVSVAELLLHHPELRHVVRRVQISVGRRYAEIRDNTISAELRAVDLLRYKLAYFGASRFDPRSDRWIRITMFQHAPFPDEFETAAPDDWAYPLESLTETLRDPTWATTTALESGESTAPRDGISCSRAELAALVRKAAKGTGLSWGESDDIASGVSWIAARDDGRVPSIVDALVDLDQRGHTRQHPVVAAIARADLAGTGLGPELAPDLIGSNAHIGHVRVAERTWNQLLDLAWRTYVPETEHSRLRGAGAGLSDND